MQVRLVKEFRFEAAHRLPMSRGPRVARLHGHSFKLELTIGGPVNEETGWFVDYQVSTARGSRLSAVDHRYLNEVPGLENPTSENLARFLRERLAVTPALERVTIFETCDARCEYEWAVTAG